MNDADSVLFEVLTTGRLQVGVATLNRPRTLNGLSLPMCELLYDKLMAWANDPSIAFVILTGAGEKAFCAGGDLHGIYDSILNNETGNAWDNPYTRRFFDIEYRLDYLIHDYPKPVLCWGNGIVMGGGVGLMAGASHRVVSETTRFAMPEITIGLFPDVGGTWLLSRLPGGVGRFLALTGAQLGAADCLFLGLADHALESAHWPEFIAAVQKAAWHDEADENAITLEHLLKSMAMPIEGAGPLRQNYDAIRHACDGGDFHAICNAIARFANHSDPWLQKAAATFAAGSPGSARLSFTLLERARLLSLADVFRQEYIVSLQCGVQGDLQEGIRALLIDKDRQPRWNPATLQDATTVWVERFFEEPWPVGNEHPLADLGS
ncbi:MAG: enoyl-CoA hydratase/isomerase family protein [Alcaligenaceae bacterium]|nr:enoyl-CoA hydratase/isomerase family protein [Alcaligenaceae bacterium]